MKTPLKTTCPWCRDIMLFATPVGGDWTPTAGDVALCVTCGRFGMFDDKLDLRRPDKATADFLAHDQLSIDAQKLWRSQQTCAGLGNRQRH